MSRHWRLLVGMMGLCAASAGCDHWHKQQVRSNTGGPATADGEIEAKSGVQPETKGFFKPTRRPAALSSEAAEVERDFGIGGR